MPVESPVQFLRPREPKPEWLKVRAPGLGQFRPAQGHHAGAEAEHRVRGRPLPQHRRVLAPRHGDVHDSRRRLHARLRLLRGGARAAQRARHRGTGPRGRGRRAHGIAVRGHHVGGSRRPGRRRRVDLRRDDPPDARARAGVPHRGPDSGLPGDRGVAAHGARRRARRAEPQRRDRAAPLPDGAVGRPLHAHARAAGPVAHLPARHRDQDRADGGPGRGAGRAADRVRRSAPGGRLDPDHRPVPAALGQPRARWRATTTPTSSRI